MLRLLFIFQDGTFLGGLVVVLSNPDVKIVTTALEVHVYIYVLTYIQFNLKEICLRSRQLSADIT